MSQLEDDNLQLEKRVNNALDSSIEDLHPDIRRKLNQARIKALETKNSNVLLNRPIWKTAGAISFVALIAFVTLEQKQNELLSPSETNINALALNNEIFDPLELDLKLKELEELDQLEEFELLEQLEFALWMAEENQIASL